MLDDSRNDIYLIIDKKSKLVNCKFHLNYSNFYCVPPINIYWGSYSQIAAELSLFKAAAPEHYAYYHLMSGQGLPLVNQDKVHAFFDNHLHHEFLQYQTQSLVDTNDKLNFHLFINNYDDGIHSEHSGKNILIKLFFSSYRQIERVIDRLIPEHKIPINRVSAASSWVSIDDKLVHIIVDNANWIYSKFHRGKVIDELFIPTLINYYPNILRRVYDRHKYKEHSLTLDNPLSNLRYIRKDSAHPDVWKINNYKELIQAKNKGFLFSRKFDENVDNNIINQIFNDVMLS